MDRLQKISKKLKLNVEQLESIIVYNHELNNFIPKKELKKVALDLNLKSLKLVNKIAETLKVDKDAVIGYLLKEYIKERVNCDK